MTYRDRSALRVRKPWNWAPRPTAAERSRNADVPREPRNRPGTPCAIRYSRERPARRVNSSHQCPRRPINWGIKIESLFLSSSFGDDHTLAYNWWTFPSGRSDDGESVAIPNPVTSEARSTGPETVNAIHGLVEVLVRVASSWSWARTV